MTGARRPSPAIVIDTNIVIGMVLGARKRFVWDLVNTRRLLLISVEGVAEVMSVASHAKHHASHAVEDATALLAFLDVLPAEDYESMLSSAAEVLRNAPASRNGSEKDAHILALAWTYDADIWSHDRDFAGTGWPSWSSANLSAALNDEAAASAIDH